MADRIGLMVHADSGPGVLHQLTGVIARARGDIASVEIVNAGSDGSRTYFEVDLDTPAEALVAELRALPIVRDVRHVGTLQANIPLFPDASPDDGRIDLVVLAPRRISHWPRLALGLVIKSWRERGVERFTGKRIQVRADRAARRELDGDTISEGTTLVAEVDPSALVVRVP